MYLWGGLILGVSTLGGGAGGGRDDTHGGTAYKPLGDVWGSALPYRVGNGVVTQVRVWGEVGVGMGAMDVAKFPSYCMMASISWTQN